MKRAWMKKIRAVSTRTTNNDGLEGQSDPAQPQTKRRVRTSAAMIGLAISMGTSNLLVTRPSDRTPAAEPTGNEPLVNSIPTDPEVSLGKTEELIVAPAVVKSLPTAAATMLNSRLLPNPQIRLQTATPDLSSLTQAHQAARQQQQSSPPPTTQVDLAKRVVASTAVSSNRAPKLPKFPPTNTVNRYSNQQQVGAKSTSQAHKRNQLLQQLKISQTAKTVSRSQPINHQQISLPAITTATNLPQAKSISPQQKALVDRLKQQSLKAKLTAWQQQSTTTASATQPTEPASPPVTAAFVIPAIPETAANQSSVVAAKVALNYQVKAGDTLTAIANQYGVGLSELVKTNNLPNPNQLRVQQQLKIPVAANSSVAQVPVPNSTEPQAPQAIATTPQTSSLPLELQTNPQAQPQSFSGMGGNISTDDTVVPLSSATQSAATKSQLQPNPYIQGLRADVENLRQKYSAQRATGQAIAPTTASSVVADPASNLSPQTQLPASQPVNPEFLMAQQVPNRSKPAAKPQRSPQASSASAQPKSNVATAPLGLDAAESLDSLRGQHVSPELPPLGAAANYLPKPNASLKGFIWPARGALTSGYGWRWGRMHKGIDIAAPVGTPIFAAASGVVIKAGWNRGGYGKLVDIQHADGSLTRYAHNNKILVQAGQQVEQGQQISEMGNSGFSTGPHLHFEVHPMGKKAVDPIAYLPGK